MRLVLALALLVGLGAPACKRTPTATMCPIGPATGPSPGTPTKIMQLVGDSDLETKPPTPTRSLTATNVGLLGTDLGFSFMHRGKLWFLFGDTVARDPSAQRPKDSDAIAWSDSFVDAGADPAAGDRGLSLNFLTEPDALVPGKTAFQPVRLDGNALGTVELPTTGFSDGDAMYVFFVVKGKSILATSRDEGRTFQTLVRVPTPRMVNIMPIVLPSADVPGADMSSPQTVLMYGRQGHNAIVLAQAPLTRIADAASWRFATSASDGTGWGTDGAAAGERVPASCECNGNFSITYVEGLGKWLMLNRCDVPHAILLRTARSALGPWSEPRTFFDREGDRGLCHFMHKGCDPAAGNCCDDNFSPSLFDHWGPHEDGYPYAPFPVAPYTRWDEASRTATLYFLMSVWNPYSPMLMRVRLAEASLP